MIIKYYALCILVLVTGKVEENNKTSGILFLIKHGFKRLFNRRIEDSIKTKFIDYCKNTNERVEANQINPSIKKYLLKNTDN